ncbi:MAG TPA: outer membrane beta-barrel protein [Planctomycetaceae bacterium]|nr:outer membrane beta-barrel protein [Planctomycetaceae bacterium]
MRIRRPLLCAAVAACVVGLGVIARSTADDLTPFPSAVASLDPPPPAQPAVTPPAAAATPPADAPAATNSAETPPEPWFLMKSLEGTAVGDFLKREKIEISGWTDLSFTASTDRSSNLPQGFNYLANQFLLDQNWLRIDRPVDTNSSDPSFGFRSDTILPGSDYRFTLARGLFSGQLSDDHGGPNRYGIDPIQFYGEAYFPSIAQGMDVKIGHFFTLYGVETTDTINTPLFSHSYTDLYDPFTHTGILTTTKLSDAWTVQAGLVLGSDVFIDPADTPTFAGTARWTAKDQKDSVLFSVILGSGRFNQARDFHNPEVFDLVYTHKFSDKLSYNFESLFGFTTNVPDIGTAEWFGILNYLTYEISPRVSSTTRLEFFDDVQGERTGFAGLYTSLTAGLSFKPWPWLILRPELRYDVNDESRPFENKHDLFTAASDLIVRW